MPQRFLKPGLLMSERWNRCSWHAQSFYVRLITLVDDFGRYEASALLLRNLAFPLNEDVRTLQVQQLCQELQANQLAIFYKVDGKDYLQMLKWTERLRASTSHHPGPCGSRACKHLLSSDNICSPPRPSSPSSTPPASSPQQVAADVVVGLAESIWPTLKEWTEAAKMDGLVEWKAVEEWHYQEKLSPPWKNVGNWRKHLAHVRTKWEQAGRPMQPPNTNANNRASSQQRINRNTGTANEGNESKYERLGKVVKG